MKIRTRFTARVITFCDLPGRTRKPERYAELAVDLMEGRPLCLTVRVPYRGGLDEAGVQEGDTITFTATLAGEESEQVMSYLHDVLVRRPEMPTPAVVQPVPASLPTQAAPSSPTVETFTALVGEYSLMPRFEGMTPERHVELHDVTDASGIVRLKSTLVRCDSLGSMRFGPGNPGDEIRFRAVLALGRLDEITGIETVRSRWQRVRGDDAD